MLQLTLGNCTLKWFRNVVKYVLEVTAFIMWESSQGALSTELGKLYLSVPL